MSVMEKDSGFAGRIEFFVRRVFERVGGAIDFALRRGGQSRTDLSALTPQIERAIETNLRRKDSQIIAPNLIELRYDYETYTRMGQKRREFLQRELSASAYEYIYNRRYTTLDTVQVKIAYDAFTLGLEIKVDFGEGKQAVVVRSGAEQQAGEELSSQAKKDCHVILRGLSTLMELHARVSSDAEPVGIGRNIANTLIIKDPTVSNFHAAFVLKPDGMLELGDRSSANGTYVNGVLLGSGDKTIVRDGDRVRFGDVEMMLTLTMKDH